MEALLKALQESLTEAETREQSLRAELAEVKKDNLRLAEENLKLQAQHSASLVKSEPKSEAKGELQRPEPQRQAVRGRVMRPIGSNASLSKVNNQNIGWFD